jgi:negative regulator of flagellin synthesis FlgM
MRLTPVSEQITSELKKVEHARKVDTSAKAKNVRTDKSEFSSNAQRLSDTKANLDIAKARLDSEPDIREEKVAEVREKIESGFYDSPEFIDKLADKIIKDFGLAAQ